MHADFWLERWEKNQIGFHADEINRHLQNFWSPLNIPVGSTIFVPLCGKSRDILWLLSQGYQVVAVELSSLAVKSFFSENSLSASTGDSGAFQRWEVEGLTMFQGDFFALTSEDLAECNAIYDRAALVALPAEMRMQYTKHLQTIAPQIRHTLLITLEYQQSEMAGPPFSVTEKEVQRLFGETCEIGCLFVEDILSQNEQFKQRGLTTLLEKVYSFKQ